MTNRQRHAGFPSALVGLVMGVLLISQGLEGQTTAPSAQRKLTGAEKLARRVEAIRQEDKRALPPKNAIVFIGSSSIQLWSTLAADFPGQPVVNRGISGQEIPVTLERVEEFALAYQPAAIVCYAGENDMAVGLAPGEAISRMSELLSAIRASRKDLPVIFLSVKPSPFRIKLTPQFQQFNALLKELISTDPKAVFVDVASPLLLPDGQPDPALFRDGVHLNERGYSLWVQTLQPVLSSLGLP